MKPLRTQIREALIDRLSQGKWKGRIFDNPTLAFDPAQLPLVVLSIEKDHVLEDCTAILPSAVGNQCLELHELSFRLKILVKTTKKAMDHLDEITRDLITGVLSDPTLAGLCKAIRVNEISEMTHSEDAESFVSSATLQGVLWYRVLEARPDESVR